MKCDRLTKTITGKVLRESTAWDLIGWDDGPIRIKGGTALYEAVLYNCANNAQNVKLARLEIPEPMKVREVSRYVTPETIIEIMEVRPS